MDISPICFLTANPHYCSGTLNPECNDLSQFVEDTGEPSIHVQEFNLVISDHAC